MISVFEVGSQIEFIESDLKARVLQVSITARNRVTYEVVWWVGNERKTSWVNEFEVRGSVTNQESLKIGFNRTGKEQQ